jgi:hypothetical protein
MPPRDKSLDIDIVVPTATSGTARVDVPARIGTQGVKRLRTVDQDRRRRVDHPVGCDDAAPRLEARSEA